MNDATTQELHDAVTEAESDGWDWAMVEIMGHRSHAGRCREVEQFGAKMLRIDIPIKGDPANGWETRLYSGASIFSYTPTTEASVMRANKPYESAARYSLPKPEEDRDPFDTDEEDDAAGDQHHEEEPA